MQDFKISSVVLLCGSVAQGPDRSENPREVFLSVKNQWYPPPPDFRLGRGMGFPFWHYVDLLCLTIFG